MPASELTQLFAEFTGMRIGLRSDIGDQALPLVRDDQGTVNGRVPAQNGFDFAGFDPETTDLDLLIRTTDELQPT
ncbi:hypothetical protein, partial [Streptomyces sp. TYQ1024]|uniref:hypothetical protein n=1 Tax=Streptomyces sp. TYQ1024 TaxID=2762559 RepID=UPI0021AF0E70